MYTAAQAAPVKLYIPTCIVALCQVRYIKVQTLSYRSHQLFRKWMQFFPPDELRLTPLSITGTTLYTYVNVHVWYESTHIDLCNHIIYHHSKYTE